MNTPRIKWAPPSWRVPDISHSVHTVPPSTAERSTRVVMSGTAATVCVQLRRTCSLPRNVRFGCAGASSA